MDDGNTNNKGPESVRVSLGSAIALGLMKGSVDALPSTVYLLTYHAGRCSANCQFCSQAKSSTSRSDFLSRVAWPVFPTKDIVSNIRESGTGKIRRICIQAVNYPEAFNDVVSLIKLIRLTLNVPISLSCQPFRGEQLHILAEIGLDRVGIPLDAATENIFIDIKGIRAGGTYTWKDHLEALRTAVNVLGRGHVSTHFIVGLGETDAQLVAIIQEMVDMGVYPSLFAFTPIKGTALENRPQPPLARYRRIQVAHHLITVGKTSYSAMKFGEEGGLKDYGVSPENLEKVIESGKPFLTSGCPDCNRPFYNEKAGGPLYNYPRPLTRDQVDQARRELVLDR